MKGYKGKIEELTLENNSFRKVLYTGAHSQLVLMCLAPNQDIGFEVHTGNDQFFRFESGVGKVIIDESEYIVEGGDAVIIPQGAKHNIINTSDSLPLKLYTIYAPPHHKDGVERITKEEAVASAPEYDGQNTE